MKVIGINGSARKDGNTSIILNIVFEELNRNGIETEQIWLGDKKIEPCKGCFSCNGKKECVYAKDDFKKIFNKMIQADGILLGSPVYSADISGIMKVFLERAGVIIAGNQGMLAHKVGASLAAVRRAGGMAAVDTMNHFFLNKEVFLVGSTYWNMVYGMQIGDVLSDEEGIKNMKNLGENMSLLLKSLHSC